VIDTRSLTAGQLHRLREWVLRLANERYPNAEIAKALGITHRQVQSHKRWLYANDRITAPRASRFNTKKWEGPPIDWMSGPDAVRSGYATGPWSRLEGLYEHLLTTNAKNRAVFDVDQMVRNGDEKSYRRAQLALSNLSGYLESLREIVQDREVRDEARGTARHDKEAARWQPGRFAGKPMPERNTGLQPGRSHQIAWAGLYAGTPEDEIVRQIVVRGGAKTEANARRAIDEVRKNM